MENPKCKLCGHKHAGVDHIWDKVTVTKSEPIKNICNQCVTKDVEIARLRNQIAEIESRSVPTKAKRDRAEYMRKYRSMNSQESKPA